MPIFVANNTVNAAPSSIVNPLECEAKLGNHNCFYLRSFMGSEVWRNLRLSQRRSWWSYSSGIWRRVFKWVFYDISKEHSCPSGLWRRWHCGHLKHQELLLERHGVTCRNIWIVSSVAESAWSWVKELQLPSASLNTRKDTCRHFRTHTLTWKMLWLSGPRLWSSWPSDPTPTVRQRFQRPHKTEGTAAFLTSGPQILQCISAILLSLDQQHCWNKESALL